MAIELGLGRPPSAGPGPVASASTRSFNAPDGPGHDADPTPYIRSGKRNKVTLDVSNVSDILAAVDVEALVEHMRAKGDGRTASDTLDALAKSFRYPKVERLCH